MKLRDGDQPLPTPNGRTGIQTLLIEFIEQRRELGISRYGTELQAFNGRDALQDALEEAGDLLIYLMQVKVERDENALLASALRKILSDEYTVVGEKYEMISLHAHAVDLLSAEERAAVLRVRAELSDPGETMHP